MRASEKQVLIANLTESVDAIEAVLIQRGLCSSAEILAVLPIHRQIVEARVANLRKAIDFL